MLNKILDALNCGKLTTNDLEAAERLFRFLADALKETRVELEVTGFDPELERLIKEKQIIPAIKLYRQTHDGAGLKEAKEAVERMGDAMGVRKNGSWGHNWK